MCDRAHDDLADALVFLLDHGVNLEFALRVFDMSRHDVWTPTFTELVFGGVVEK